MLRLTRKMLPRDGIGFARGFMGREGLEFLAEPYDCFRLELGAKIVEKCPSHLLC